MARKPSKSRRKVAPAAKHSASHTRIAARTKSIRPAQPTKSVRVKKQKKPKSSEQPEAVEVVPAPRGEWRKVVERAFFRFCPEITVLESRSVLESLPPPLSPT